MNSWLNCPSFQIVLFSDLVNITSTPMGQWVATEIQGVSCENKKKSNETILISRYDQINGKCHRIVKVIPSHLSAWIGNMEPFKDHLSTSECQTSSETSQEKSSDTHLDS